MGKRVFIALPADEVFRKKASSFRDSHGTLPVRWILPENLHVTLVPPWYCEDVEGVCGKLHDLLDGVRAFGVCFHEISIGPTSRNPRLVWASGGAHVALGELRGRLSGLAEPQAGGPERAFLLHITLARIRKGEKINMSPQAIDWKVKLGSVCLYESILRPSGAEYRVLCRVGLGRE